jgi:hypothetical protein
MTMLASPASRIGATAATAAAAVARRALAPRPPLQLDRRRRATLLPPTAATGRRRTAAAATPPPQQQQQHHVRFRDCRSPAELAAAVEAATAARPPANGNTADRPSLPLRDAAEALAQLARLDEDEQQQNPTLLMNLRNALLEDLRRAAERAAAQPPGSRLPTPRALATALWACARLGMRGECADALQRALLRLLLPEEREQQQKTTTTTTLSIGGRDAATALWAVASLGQLPAEGLVDALLAAAPLPDAGATEYSAQSLSNALWALGSLEQGGPGRAGEWARRAARGRLRELLLLLATSSGPSPLTTAIDRLTPQGVSSALWALARLGWRPEEEDLTWLWHGTAAALFLSSTAPSPQALATTLWAVAVICGAATATAAAAAPAASPPLPPSWWLASWRRAALSLSPRFNTQDLANACWATARLEQQRLRLKNVAANDDDNNTTADAKAARETLRHLLAASRPRLPHAHTEELASLLCSAALLRVPPPEAWMRAWLGAMSPRLSTYCAPALAASLRALAALGYLPPPRWSARLLAGARRQLPAFGSQGLANAAWAVGKLGGRRMVLGGGGGVAGAAAAPTTTNTTPLPRSRSRARSRSRSRSRGPPTAEAALHQAPVPVPMSRSEARAAEREFCAWLSALSRELCSAAGEGELSAQEAANASWGLAAAVAASGRAGGRVAMAVSPPERAALLKAVVEAAEAEGGEGEGEDDEGAGRRRRRPRRPRLDGRHAAMALWAAARWWELGDEDDDEDDEEEGEDDDGGRRPQSSSPSSSSSPRRALSAAVRRLVALTDPHLLAPRELSSVLWALARMSHRPPRPWLAEWCAAAESAFGGGGGGAAPAAADVATAAWALGRLLLAADDPTAASGAVSALVRASEEALNASSNNKPGELAALGEGLAWMVRWRRLSPVGGGEEQREEERAAHRAWCAATERLLLQQQRSSSSSTARELVAVATAAALMCRAPRGRSESGQGGEAPAPAPLLPPPSSWRHALAHRLSVLLRLGFGGASSSSLGPREAPALLWAVARLSSNSNNKGEDDDDADWWRAAAALAARCADLARQGAFGGGGGDGGRRQAPPSEAARYVRQSARALLIKVNGGRSGGGGDEDGGGGEEGGGEAAAATARAELARLVRVTAALFGDARRD